MQHLCLVAAVLSVALSIPALAQQSAVDSLYAVAAAEHNAGRLAAALEAYSAVIALDSTHVDSFWNRAHILVGSERYEEAICDYAKVADLAPDFGDGHGTLGWYLILSGEYDAAAEPTRTAAHLDPSTYSWPLNLGHIHLLSGRVDSARVYYRRVVPLMRVPEDSVVIANDFRIFAERGWQPEAVRALGGWLQAEFAADYPLYRKADSLRISGADHARLEQIREAAHAYRSAADLEYLARNRRVVELKESLVRAAQAFSMIGDNGRTETVLAEVVRLADSVGSTAEVAEYSRVRGRFLASSGRYVEAASAYGRAYEIDEAAGDSQRVLVSLRGMGNAYRNRRRFREAIAVLERAVSIARGRDEEELLGTLGDLGRTLLEADLADEAEPRIKEALAIAFRLGDSEAAGENLRLAGRALKDLDPDSSLVLLRQSLEIHTRRGNSVGGGLARLEMGRIHSTRADYADALTEFRQARQSFEGAGSRLHIAQVDLEIAKVSAGKGESEEAFELLRSALETSQDLGVAGLEMRVLSEKAQLHVERGELRAGISILRDALRLVREVASPDWEALHLDGIGNVFLRWARYDSARVYFERARVVRDSVGDTRGRDLISLNNIGLAYKHLDRYDSARVYFKRSLDAAEKFGSKRILSRSLNQLASLHVDLKEYTQALELLERALALGRTSEEPLTEAMLLTNIGAVHSYLGQHETALEHHARAVEVLRPLGAGPALATALNNMALSLDARGRPQEAIGPLHESIALFERIRSTASPSERLTFLASQVASYRPLVSLQVREDSLAAAFLSAQNIQARVLAERLRSSEDSVYLMSVEALQRLLSKDALYLAVIQPTNVSPMVRLVVSRDGIVAHELDEDILLGLLPGHETKDADVDERLLTSVISSYRDLLGRGVGEVRGAGAAPSGDSASVVREEAARALHDLLLGGLDEEMASATRLLIAAEGPLALIPFETLVDPDGRYLAERFDVSYVQSPAVLEVLTRRGYPEKRRPMLAFGGALYDTGSAIDQVVDGTDPLDVVRARARSRLSRGGAQSESYAELGYVSWSDLPGALEEVQEIDRLVEGAVTVTGKRVAESTVKSMSVSGELARYAVLHFATHGIVVPEVPEMSALVLSQAVDSTEDGYLRMNEIAELELRADFVNLSACETGLGRVYGGEGVVGLAQSFLVAGANRLSVSLWQVDDVSTSVFMQEMYRRVLDEGVSYRDAISATKRAFIAGEYGNEWRDPYYWAPFVYYGL